MKFLKPITLLLTRIISIVDMNHSKFKFPLNLEPAIEIAPGKNSDITIAN